MQVCQDGHGIPVRGHLSVTWCPECARFEIKVWAADTSSVGERVSLLPEWAHVIRLEDDEWASRSLTKYVTGLAQTVRTITDDERRGVARLF